MKPFRYLRCWVQDRGEKEPKGEEVSQNRWDIPVAHTGTGNQQAQSECQSELRGHDQWKAEEGPAGPDLEQEE